MEDDSSAYPGYGEMYRGSLKNNPEQEIGSLRDQTLECIDQFDSEKFDEKGQYFMSPDESSQLFMYFTMAAAVIEELSIALLTKVLTDAERSTKSSSDFLERDLTQNHRQRLLFQTGIIGDGTHGEMDRLRKHRNDIVHSSRERKIVQDVEETRDKVGGGYRATESLWEKLRNA